MSSFVFHRTIKQFLNKMGELPLKVNTALNIIHIIIITKTYFNKRHKKNKKKTTFDTIVIGELNTFPDHLLGFNLWCLHN